MTENSTENSSLNDLLQAVRPYRERLMRHALYTAVNSEARLQRFMEAHVFAVWDFMSLLKTLQARLTCVDVPWLPPRDATAARLINEIVLAEESDEYVAGTYASHLQMYLDAMRDCGASTRRILEFCQEIQRGASVEEGLQSVGAGEVVTEFVKTTFAVIRRDRLSEIAAAFLFGREDPIPEMFQRLLTTLGEQSAERYERLRFYLERHITLDSGDHGPKALRLVISLCGGSANEWQQATLAAVQALQARERLWDGLLISIQTLP